MNRTLWVLRILTIFTDAPNVIDLAGLSEYFTAVGKYPLYAYAAEAGVGFLNTGALVTQDFGLLSDI